MTSAATASGRFSRFAWITLGANLAVILWGAFVRATGSGAGCGSHWPLCNGEAVPRSPSAETLIELTHRLTSGVALLMVIAMLWWAYRAFPRGHPVRWAAWASTVLIFVEAAIGAGLVLFELVAENESMARALFMATHLANTFLLLAALTLTAAWPGDEEPRGLFGRTLEGTGISRWMVSGTLLALIATGVSGAVAALGDTLFPALSFAEAIQQDLSPTAHILVRLRVLHPLIALGGGLLAFLLARGQLHGSTAATPRVERYAQRTIALVFLQLAGGVLNVALLAPVWMQLVHLLVADLLWIQVVLLAEAATSRGARRATAVPP